MSTIPDEPNDDQAAFYAAALAEQERLAAVLAEIRADRESGELTAAEAARNWVEAAEAHLRKVRVIRREYFGDDPSDDEHRAAR